MQLCQARHVLEFSILAVGFSLASFHGQSFSQDASRELALPSVAQVPPESGKRVPITPPEYLGTAVHHMVYLPSNWSQDMVNQGRRYPVIVEYTGNHFPQSFSTGKVEDAGLGFGLSSGQFIWITLPFVDKDHQKNAIRWWGDIDATVEYALVNVPRICQRFGGDPQQVLLCGFSRGAIAVNLIGLHDDRIAKLWCGFVTHDHFDGEREWRKTNWGSPLQDYRLAAEQRLERVAGRPYLVCQAGTTEAIQNYLRSRCSLDAFTFLDVNVHHIFGAFPNETAAAPHTDRWLLKPSDERERAWQWVHRHVGSTLQTGQ
ncbi:alpha/beta hydrolase family protein [Novipirellula artificiosorum]|uniref:Alpha/beta hydrolase family protein n=1 Tax=Novipirellula artificiosorum TaxID=2528016 RepID=A0A5C6DCJ8_9BACT|nr:hypothetical protein [Novipirellula artificiosorum]TWU34482.1 hypothetical protein Poly41_46300 [Novipirellula artificiosorum]